MRAASPSSHPKEDFPVVIKNKLTNWRILNYTQEDWCNVFKDKLLKFRQGKKTFTRGPYWEHLCESKEITLDKFFEVSSQNPDSWLYYDYKYVKDILPEKFVEEIKWGDLGLVEFKGEESALWIGNEGAHTPCHMDTYGCNLVAQLFGRKLWILLPPDESEQLKPIRVPYEESSVYSSFNFYSPDEGLLCVKEAYKVVLSPGDVLYVPRHWWHYVENLEPAISINIWIPLDEDHESRLEESLVQHYISTLCMDLTKEEAEQILNPNEYGLISEPCTLSLVEQCLENYKKYRKQKGRFQIVSRFGEETIKPDKLCLESYIESKSKMNKSVEEESRTVDKGKNGKDIVRDSFPHGKDSHWKRPSAFASSKTPTTREDKNKKKRSGGHETLFLLRRKF